jgi:Capsule polysaccharide biosynthesis protein
VWSPTPQSVSHRAGDQPMRFLFTTLQFTETDFYRRVSEQLAAWGHSSDHITYSRLAARRLRGAGHRVHCLPDVMRGDSIPDIRAELARLEAAYPIPSIRDVYLPDAACVGRSEQWCIERTVRHFRAMERLVADGEPSVIVPEVGSETMRTVAHLVGRRHGAAVLFLFYTIFPNPLRLYLNDYHAPIVPLDALQELAPREREDVDQFIKRFTTHARPILPYRRTSITPSKVRNFARHLVVRATYDRDNEYLTPGRYLANYFRRKTRKSLSPLFYSPLPTDRPYVYFPLHVTDDFKIKRVIPHCVDQEYLIRLVADALPEGYEVVLKEHPASIGRNSLAMLMRLRQIPNTRIIHPRTSSHGLIRGSAAVMVISSTVGLEALLYGKPVLTLGQPFYSGYGFTVDVDSFREVRHAVPTVLTFTPDRERILQFLYAAMRSTYPGAPASVDQSNENAARLATALDAAVRQSAGERGAVAV